MPEICCKINNQEISWGTVQRVRAACSGDWHRTMSAFYRARTKEKITAYVLAGLKKDNPYSLVSGPEMDVAGGKSLLERWWQDVSVWTPKGNSKKDPASVLDVLAEIVKKAQSKQ